MVTILPIGVLGTRFPYPENILHMKYCNHDNDEVTDGCGHGHAVHQAGAEGPDPDPWLQPGPALPHHLNCRVLETGEQTRFYKDFNNIFHSVAYCLITMEAL